VLMKPVTVGDVEELRDVALRAYKDHYLHLWYDSGEWYMEKSFSISNLSIELNNSNAKFYIIYLDNVAAGFLKLNIDAPFPSHPNLNLLELERIYLTKAASGKGVGSAAVDFVCNIAAEYNKQAVWLKVMDSSEGPITFYKKHGFEICGTFHLDFEQMKEEVRGMYVMKKSIGSYLTPVLDC